MKKLIKPIFILFLGIFFGYYICDAKPLELFNINYKAFQVGVYTNLEAATTYSVKYKNSTIIKDNELYRVYVAILKDKKNIENMSNYLESKNIEYYLKDISINDKNLKKTLNEYENIMDTENEIVFLEMNKLILKKYEESI